ncbi:MAG: c-type cytochrome [Thermodesulfobacteriota bacterium]
MKKALFLLLGLGLVVMVLYQALVYYDNSFPYGRMRETPAVKPLEQPVLPMPKQSIPVSGGEDRFKSVSGQELAPPFHLQDKEIISRGKSVYTVYCLQCHGPGHAGRGTVGQSFQPLPTDLRSQAVQGQQPGVLFKSISYGLPGGRQPPLQNTIRAKDRWKVVAYIKSLDPRPGQD